MWKSVFHYTLYMIQITLNGLWTNLQNKRRRPLTQELRSHGTHETLQDKTGNSKDFYWLKTQLAWRLAAR